MNWPRSALLGAALLALGIAAGGTTNAQEMGGSSYPGPYFIGAPDAPVVFEEYADFQ